MLQGIVFDFDGVIVNNEPLHFRALQRVLKEEAIPLAESQYYATYLGMDDRGCITTALEAAGRLVSPATIADLASRKARYYDELIRNGLVVFPGSAEFVTQAASRWPLAIASGALRVEIESILARLGLERCFSAIVSAEDVRQGKPHPEGFLQALAALRRIRPGPSPLMAEDCLAIEDSTAGIAAAKAAGMRVLAVTHTFPREALTGADLIVPSLHGLDPFAVAGQLA